MDEPQGPPSGASSPRPGSDPSPAHLEQTDDAAAGRYGITPSLRLLLGLAAVAIVLVFMRSAATIINPLLLAVVVTMAVSPLLHWLVRKGFPLWAAWLITVVVTLVAVAIVVAAVLIGVARLIGEVPRYQAQLAVRWQHATDALGHLGHDRDAHPGCPE